MGALETLRNETASLITAAVATDWPELTCAPAWPGDIGDPCIFLAPPLGEDWVKPGPMFGEWTVVIDIVVLSDEDTATAALEVLEDLAEAILPALHEYAILAVESPTPTSVVEGGTEYLGTIIRVSKAIRFESE